MQFYYHVTRSISFDSPFTKKLWFSCRGPNRKWKNTLFYNSFTLKIFEFEFSWKKKWFCRNKLRSFQANTSFYKIFNYLSNSLIMPTNIQCTHKINLKLTLKIKIWEVPKILSLRYRWKWYVYRYSKIKIIDNSLCRNCW